MSNYIIIKILKTHFNSTQLLGRIKYYYLSFISLIAFGSFKADCIASDVIEHRPSFREERILVDHKERGVSDYLAFPAITQNDQGMIWISFKRGTRHVYDLQADLIAVEFNPITGRLTGQSAQVGEEDIVYQMGEWIRYPNGKLETYTRSGHKLNN